MRIQVSEYRQLLIQSIHVTAIKFSEVAASVVYALREFFEDSNNPSALDVVAFVRQVLHLMTFHAFITDFPCLANSKVVDKFPISVKPSARS
jgi:hypothetical protein